MVWTWGPDPIMRSVLAEGLEPGEVLWVLSHDPRWPRPMRAPDTGVFTLTVWGRTSAGRGVLVATRPLSGRDWEIVGARPLTAAEDAELAGWEADRARRNDA
ncbi:hypothetical protein Kisp01_38140 [Kineosporia sp. NBRC 101677]|nr:hypothetical protein Kisp01_38140 [Kineosporia sp. NBRC 101677]